MNNYYKPYIKVLYLSENYSVTIDFKQYETTSPSLFFINSNQCQKVCGIHIYKVNQLIKADKPRLALAQNNCIYA